jgi:hypothetical protein
MDLCRATIIREDSLIIKVELIAHTEGTIYEAKDDSLTTDTDNI